MQHGVGRQEAREVKYVQKTTEPKASAPANSLLSRTVKQAVSLPEVTGRPQDNQKQNTTDVKMEFRLTCSGSTWQNIEIFSFTDVSRGFEHLHTT